MMMLVVSVDQSHTIITWASNARLLHLLRACTSVNTALLWMTLVQARGKPPFSLLSWCWHRHYLEGGGAPKPPLSLRGPGSVLSAVGQPLPPPPCGGAKVPLEPRIGPKAALGTSPNGRVPDCGNWGLPDGFTPYPWSPRDIRTPGARYFLCCPRAGYRSIPPRQHPTEAWVVHCHPFIEPRFGWAPRG